MRKVATAIVALAVAFSAAAYVFLDFSQITAFFGFGDDIVLLEDEYGEVLWEGKTIPPASEYIQDGLIGMWDGIENAGPRRHSNTASTWIDLAGSRNLTKYSAGTWQDFYLHCDGTRVGAMSSGKLAGVEHIEGCFSVPTETAASCMIFCFAETNMCFSTGIRGGLAFQGVDARCAQIIRDTFCTYSYSFSGLRYRNGAVNAAARDYTRASRRNNVAIGGRENSAAVAAKVDVACIRVYNRTLTPEEIAYNYALDKERFGLP